MAVHGPSGQSYKIHGTCLGQVVHAAIERRAHDRERNHLENGPGEGKGSL